MDKRALAGVLAMAALSLASTTPQLPRGRSTRDFDAERAAYQKRLARSKLTEEQLIWNDAVDARRLAKLAAANLKARGSQ